MATKRLLCGMLLYVIMWCVTPVGTATAQNWSLGAAGHYGMLLDRYKDLLQNPYGGTIAARFEPKPGFRLGAYAGYYNMPTKDEKKIKGGSILPIAVFAEVAGTRGRLRPFVGFELGMYHLSAREFDVNDRSDESIFGYGVSTGLIYTLGPLMDAQFTVRYNNIWTQNPTVKLLTAGLGLNYYFGERSKKLWAGGR